MGFTFVIIQGDALVNEASAGTAELIFAETPFYAEMGGQIADRGYVKIPQGTSLPTWWM